MPFNCFMIILKQYQNCQGPCYGGISTLLTQSINFLLTAVSYDDTHSERKMYRLFAEYLRSDFLQHELEVDREGGPKSYDTKVEVERKEAESSVRLFLSQRLN